MNWSLVTTYYKIVKVLLLTAHPFKKINYKLYGQLHRCGQTNFEARNPFVKFDIFVN